MSEERQVWRPDRNPPPAHFNMPGWGVALWRGVRMRCPSCGEASAFSGWYRVRERCPVCGAELGKVPCDTLPPYLSISLGLGVIGLGLIIADRHGDLGFAQSIEIFVPIAIVFQLAILRPITGFVLALMMKNDMYRG